MPKGIRSPTSYFPYRGSKILYPENSSGALYETMMAEDGLTKKSLVRIADRDLGALGGGLQEAHMPTRRRHDRVQGV